MRTALYAAFAFATSAHGYHNVTIQAQNTQAIRYEGSDNAIEILTDGPPQLRRVRFLPQRHRYAR